MTDPCLRLMEGKVLKTLVFFADDETGIIYRTDTIQHAGSTWLVPVWLDNPKERFRIPERIISLDALPHQKICWGEADFLLRSAIPKSVFEGQVPPEHKNQYIVVEKPNIRFPSIGS